MDPSSPGAPAPTTALTGADDWPDSLKAYISRCFNACETNEHKDMVEIILKGKITQADSCNSLWSKDWTAKRFRRVWPSPRLLLPAAKINTKKVVLPQFLGKVKDYWGFRVAFRALVHELHSEHVPYITQLKSQLPTDGKIILRGVENRHKAWEVLDQFFGDRNAVMAAILSRLQSVELSDASSYDMLENLAQAVQQATTLLRHVGAEAILESDLTLIGRLINKLPSDYVNWWNDHVAEARGNGSWYLFKEWLTKVQKTAQASRTRGLSNLLKSVQTGVRNNVQTDHIHYQRRTTKKAAEDSSAEPIGSTIRNVGAVDSDATLPAIEGIILGFVDHPDANADLEVNHRPHMKVEEHGGSEKPFALS